MSIRRRVEWKQIGETILQALRMYSGGNPESKEPGFQSASSSGILQPAVHLTTSYQSFRILPRCRSLPAWITPATYRNLRSLSDEPETVRRPLYFQFHYPRATIPQAIFDDPILVRGFRNLTIFIAFYRIVNRKECDHD
jgi:hypothetical protein